MTEDDLMFDLDLRIVPIDDKDDYTRNPQASNGCVHTSYVSEACSSRCTGSGATCYTCLSGAGTQNMCL
jgi:hypothetical protein